MTSIRITKIVRAPKDFTFKWWTDLHSNDSEIVTPLKSRKIISKTKERIQVEDIVRILGLKMKFNAIVRMYPPNKWVAEYKGKMATARSEYNLEESGEDTVIEYSTRIQAKGLIRIFMPLAKYGIKITFSSEMNKYNEQLIKDLQQK